MTPFPTAGIQVVAHRGASALLPEHTLAAHARAIADGADWIEPDLVMTGDGVLVARHENELGDSTDVAAHPRFAARRRRKIIDGRLIEGWFSEDFTLAELKTLRARERLPGLRGTAHDGWFPIPTLAEIIDLAAAEAQARGRVIGLIPELKHGTYFQHIGLPMEDALLAALAAHPYCRQAPVAIQSFEIGNLRALSDRLDTAHHNIELVQLIGAPQQSPPDVLAAGRTLRYADMLTPQGLADIAAYAGILSPERRQVMSVDEHGDWHQPTGLVQAAHAAGLKVIPYTFRPENHFLAPAFRDGDDPARIHRPGAVAELQGFLKAGIDGFFTDDPASGRLAVDAFVANR
ncbi:MAG: glycerophosphodiester phosphodiesterase family protein [Lysobacteraceae bacterium]